MWKPATLDAARRSSEKEGAGDRVSISPLELLTQALLLCVVVIVSGEELDGLRGEDGWVQIVLRCDNESACHVVGSRWAKSPGMREALSFLDELEKAYRVRVLLEHIGKLDNLAADALSHDR